MAKLTREDVERIVEEARRRETRADLSRADLSEVYLNGADLRGVYLNGTDLNGADLSDADLNFANLSSANLNGANLNGASLYRAYLREVDLSGAVLRNRANLVEANLFKANLREVGLSRAILNGTNLKEADLSRADLIRADLSEADLVGANLSRAKLIKANLSWADLSKADLSRADLSGANLYRANLNRVNLNRATLSGTNLGEANLSSANLWGANLSRATIVDTNLTRANLTGSTIYGIAAWNLNLEAATQRDLVITPIDEPVITVDNLEVAQFIYLLLHNEKIRHVIDTITAKVVLILGRFTEERKPVLDAIRNELRKRDYLPILFDFEKPTSKSFIETVGTLAHMARFVIADVTDPKIVLQEVPYIVRNIAVPVQPLLLAGSGDEAVTLYDLRANHRLLLDTYQYRDLDDLLASLGEKVIAPAEAEAEAQRKWLEDNKPKVG